MFQVNYMYKNLYNILVECPTSGAEAVLPRPEVSFYKLIALL